MYHLKVCRCAVKINDLEKYMIGLLLVSFNTKLANSSVLVPLCLSFLSFVCNIKCQTHAMTEINRS